MLEGAFTQRYTYIINVKTNSYYAQELLGTNKRTKSIFII